MKQELTDVTARTVVMPGSHGYIVDAVVSIDDLSAIVNLGWGEPVARMHAAGLADECAVKYFRCGKHGHQRSEWTNTGTALIGMLPL